MFARFWNGCRNYLPLFRRLERLPRQLLRISPFHGDIQPTRVPLIAFGSERPTFPFPHPWNYRHPIRILESYFWDADKSFATGARATTDKHSCYLEVPGFAPVLVTRDPRLIRAITTDSGDRPGQFDRDTLPSTGIARATGRDTLLYANGATWRRQKKLAAAPFGKTTLFQPEQFQQFAATFRHTIRERLAALRDRVQRLGDATSISLEPEIKAVMLEMLANNFFGAEISYEAIRHEYVPALENVIDHIVRDTVLNKLGIPIQVWPGWSRRMHEIKSSYRRFDELTDKVLAMRHQQRGLWREFRSDAPDAKLRSNIKVFLAGALEATTSFASWAIAHLARDPASQEKLYQELKDVEDYSPEHLEQARFLADVLDETLRLTPSLYFLPRRASADTRVELADGQSLTIPHGTHILLDVWHANRHEDFWGKGATGFSADQFVPQRWENIRAAGRGSKEVLHFGFGHGPRVCPGKHLGQLEVSLVVGAIVKLFRFTATAPKVEARAGVSTKPGDGVLVDMEARDPARVAAAAAAAQKQTLGTGMATEGEGT